MLPFWALQTNILSVDERPDCRPAEKMAGRYFNWTGIIVTDLPVVLPDGMFRISDIYHTQNTHTSSALLTITHESSSSNDNRNSSEKNEAMN